MSFLPTPWPLIQAPMAGVQDAQLALAVCEAGALGSLPAAMLSPEALERELAVLQAAGRPYNVNFFTHTPPVAEPERMARWQALLAPYAQELGLPPDAPTTAASRQPFGPQAAEVLIAFAVLLAFMFGGQS